MESKKTHYRKVFKSEHLGIADLEDFLEEGRKLIFTIKDVKQEMGVSVAGRKGNHNIAYFKEGIKPLVINATNSKILRGFNNNSPFVEDWANTLVELYIDYNVKMKGEVVGGVRIKPNQPRLEKPKLIPTHPRWAQAVQFYKENGHLEGVKKQFIISEENEKKIINESKTS